jgi:hypothetical protein
MMEGYSGAKSKVAIGSKGGGREGVVLEMGLKELNTGLNIEVNDTWN